MTEPHAHPAARLGVELASTAVRLVESDAATAALVQRGALDGPIAERLRALGPRLLIVIPDREEGDGALPDARRIRVPAVPLARLGQIKIALFMALSSDVLRHGDRVVALTGLSGSGNIDTLMVVDVAPEQELLAGAEAATHLPRDVSFDVFQRLITIATEIGSEGREGKPVGALFVLGDTDNVLALSRPLILNPFRGYAENERTLLDETLDETIKEFAAIDGAFVVRGDGVVEAGGVFLKAAQQGVSDLPRGLGARHHAAAAITAITEAIAVTVSESTGTVSIFRHGRLVAEIERSRPLRLKPHNPTEGRSEP